MIAVRVVLLIRLGMPLLLEMRAREIAPRMTSVCRKIALFLVMAA